MHPISQMLINQAEQIEGYSVDILINDLLTTRFKLVNYKKAAERIDVKRTTISAWVARGHLTPYGTRGNGARVNEYELMNIMLNPAKRDQQPRKRKSNAKDRNGEQA